MGNSEFGKMGLGVKRSGLSLPASDAGNSSSMGGCEEGNFKQLTCPAGSLGGLKGLPRRRES